jgi:hypothetical protein
LHPFDIKTVLFAHGQKRRRKMNIKIALALAALSCAPLTVAGDKAAYPREKVAEFIVEKLDITSLPAAIRPKKEKGKKTFADYGFTTQRVDENETILQAVSGARKLSIKVLDQRPAGIYVCVAEAGQNAGEAKTQSVVLLKRNDSNALLKGHETWREFASCPVIGGSDKDSEASAYGGD